MKPEGRIRRAGPRPWRDLPMTVEKQLNSAIGWIHYPLLTMGHPADPPPGCSASSASSCSPGGCRPLLERRCRLRSNTMPVSRPAAPASTPGPGAAYLVWIIGTLIRAQPAWFRPHQLRPGRRRDRCRYRPRPAEHRRQLHLRNHPAAGKRRSKDRRFRRPRIRVRGHVREIGYAMPDHDQRRCRCNRSQLGGSSTTAS